MIDKMAISDGGETGKKKWRPVKEITGMVLEHATIWASSDKEAFATINVNGHQEHHAIASSMFDIWLHGLCDTELGIDIKDDWSRGVKKSLACIAWQGDTHDVYIRVARLGDRIYWDLGNSNWEAIEITGHGWKVIQYVPVKFTRTGNTAALPYPVKGGDFSEFRKILACSDHGWLTIHAYLLSLFNPGSYFHVTIHGQQGSNKSGATKYLKRLIDPISKAELNNRQPTSDSLIFDAQHEFLLAYDNVSKITNEASDTLCCLSTGGGTKVRKLYTNQEQNIFSARRSVILNGIPEFTERPDLADRTLAVIQPRIEKYIDETDIEKMFDAMHPALMGAVCDQLVTGLANRHLEVLDLPRMAAPTRWVVQCGLHEFLSHHKAIHDEAQADMLERNPVGRVLPGFLTSIDKTTGVAKGMFRGKISELHEALKHYLCRESITTDRFFPATSHKLGNDIRMIEPPLRSKGFTINRTTIRGDNIITIIAPGFEE